MSVPVSLLRFAIPTVSTPALPSLGWAQWAIDAAADDKPPTDEPNKWTKVVGRYRTRWIENGEKYCLSPVSSRDQDEDYPDFPVPVLPPAISLTLADESKEEQEMPKIQVVRRWRTESIPIDQPFCLTPLPTGRVIPTDVWSLRDAAATPPPSLMPIPDEAFFHGPPQATEPSLIPIYHRSRTEWIRQGDPVAFTPGFNLEAFNAHACEPKPAVTASWTDASAWALAQKSSNPKKE
jgi:hypothetical protein